MPGWEGDAQRGSRPGLARWIALTALVPVAFAAVVVALNAGVYSPAGFVHRYLDALDRRDLAAALEMPGVTVPRGTVVAALDHDALTGLDGHRILSDADEGDGRHRVTVEYDAGGERARTEFLVQAAPPLFLVFNGWRFADTPVATLPVTVLGGDSFRINGVQVEDAAPVEPGVWAAEVAVLAPARVVLDEDSRYFTADDVTVEVTASAPIDAPVVELRASEELVEAVQDEVNGFLDACAAQRVLQPAGCPFRRTLEDRILEAPEWSIATYPEIGIERLVSPDGSTVWAVPATDGTARIRVRVLSLFDGTVSELDEAVPFRVAYTLTLREDGGLDIQAVQP